MWRAFRCFTHRAFATLPKATSFLQKKKSVNIRNHMTVQELARAMNLKTKEVLEVFREIENDPTLDAESVISKDTSEIVANEFNFLPVITETYAELPLRPPIVTIMGHVDHGKTTLLDAYRNSNICATEHGGITQGIGAFTAKTSSGGKITFIDTPGHEAFTLMRARGAQITDIIVLVVCATEGVQPQTVEAINHASDSDVPMIVAINKVDLPTADINRVELQLLEQGVNLEKFGGDVLHVPVSGKKRIGLDQLEDYILFKAELMELRADPNCMAQGTVIETKAGLVHGSACSLLVQRGTLRVGDILVVGKAFGKVRNMINEYGKSLKEAGPSDAVEIAGIKEIPNAGDNFLVVKDPKIAKRIAVKRGFIEDINSETGPEDKVTLPKLTHKERLQLKSKDVSMLIERLKGEKTKIETKGIDKLEIDVYTQLDKKTKEIKTMDERIEEISSLFSEKQNKEIKVVLKAANRGMLDALVDSVSKLASKENCPVSILESTVGSLCQHDIDLAEEFSAVILMMDLPIPKNYATQANKLGIAIKSHKIIYHLLDEILDLIKDTTGPSHLPQLVGSARVKTLFKLDSKKSPQTVAGLEVTSGSLNKRSRFRVIRNGSVIAEDLEIDTLRHFKDQVSQVAKGQECGMTFKKPVELKMDDVIEGYEIRAVEKRFRHKVETVRAEDVKDK